VTLATWLSIVAICILGALTPGPSLAVVLRHTVTNSRQHGIAAAIFHAAGVALWALLTVMGLAILVAESPVLFKVITWGGAGYLAWLGYKALTAKGDGVLKVGETDHVSWWKAGIDGLMISLLNPKLALFFIALFSQFVSADQTLSDQLIMMATAGGIDGLWYVLVAVVFSHSKVLTYLQKHTRWIDRITGGILIGLSARVVTLS